MSDCAVCRIRYRPDKNAVRAPNPAPTKTAEVAKRTPIQIPKECAKTNPPPEASIDTGRKRTSNEEHVIFEKYNNQKQEKIKKEADSSWSIDYNIQTYVYINNKHQ